VGHHVGEAAQLGLHPPLLGHVGEEDHQPIAEPHGSLHEGSEHVSVAEGVVVGDLLHPRLPRLAHAHVLVEGAAAAHPRKRLEQRVALGRRRGQAERPQHREVAVPEVEVGDLPGGVPDRPQDPNRLGKGLEQRSEAGGAALPEELDELRVLAPGLRVHR
jgi:hypothetical protein